MRSTARLIAIILAAAIAGAAITLAIVHKGEPEKDEGEQVKTPQRVTVETGEPTVEIDEKTQHLIGLATSAAASSQQMAEMQVFGSVVDVQELTALQGQAAAARAQLQQVEAKASYDRAELSRLRALNADNRAVSDRMVQEASAAVAGDEANAASANAALQAARATAVQKFGPVLSSAMMDGSALYRDLVMFRSSLVQLSLPAGLQPPPKVALTSNVGASAVARLLSPAPRVDARLQALSFFYVAPGGTLVPGMSVSARLGSSQVVRGVAIPPDAIVSWQGRSWVYVKRDATHFSRREVAGPFATNVPAGTEVVTTGAQQLLSQEMRSQLGEQ